MRHLKHTIANLLFPFHLPILDKLNTNAQLQRWLRENRSLPTFDTRFAFYDYIQKEFVGGEAIDYLEFGVFRGESLRHWTEINSNTQSRFFGFDSFKGLPEDWGPCKAGTFDTGGALPDIKDERVQFVVGWFQKTMPKFQKEFTLRSRLVINNDSDLYSSTLYVLAKLEADIAPGTILIYDEFYSAMHEFRAMQDFLLSFNRKARPIAKVNDPHGRVAFIFE